MNAFDKTVDALRKQGLNPEEILEVISKLFQQFEAKDTDTADAEADTSTKLSALLKECGIPCNVSGYLYLMEGIPLYKLNPQQKITKELYPTLAARFETTDAKVSRAIRHAIDVGFSRCDPETIKRLWGNTVKSQSGRPTNSEFIAFMAEML